MFLKENKMKILTIKKEILEKLLKDYFEYNPIHKDIMKQIDNMIIKLTEEAKETIVKEFDVIFYVKNESSFINEPTFSKLFDVSNNSKLYLYLNLMNSINEEKTNKTTIDIIIDEINEKKIEKTNNIKLYKEDIETLKTINAIIFSIDFTKSKTSLTLDLDKIDALYSKAPKNIAKGARKSIISTLTEKKKERVFRVHPEAKNRIVSFEELEDANKLDLKDKEFNCKCPICGLKYTIIKDNIDDIIRLNKNEIIFMCDHLNTEKYKELPFKIDISQFITDKKYSKKYYKQMFFINNFKRLTRV